jgi:capsule polysaccharide export protein KpsE/RkpR
MMCLPLSFLVLRAMIRYHIIISLPSLTSLIHAPHQIFDNVACMILLMILPLGLVSWSDYIRLFKATFDV